MKDDTAFLGTGWSFPPEFTKNGAEVAMVSGEKDVEQSLKILLTTAMEERLIWSDFYCDMRSFAFASITNELIASIKDIISNAILYYEPRIDLGNIKIDESKEQTGLLIINVEYTIRTTNSRYNFVYPFYLNEG